MSNMSHNWKIMCPPIWMIWIIFANIRVNIWQNNYMTWQDKSAHFSDLGVEITLSHAMLKNVDCSGTSVHRISSHTCSRTASAWKPDKTFAVIRLCVYHNMAQITMQVIILGLHSSTIQKGFISKGCDWFRIPHHALSNLCLTTVVLN